MVRKQRFPPEPDTRPDVRPSKAPPTNRVSGPAPKSRRERSEAPTLPPPGRPGAGPESDPAPQRDPFEEVSDRPEMRTSGPRTRRPPVAPSMRPTANSVANIDEVVADLTKDPRRERDDDE